jgi:hypothetical protein
MKNTTIFPYQYSIFIVKVSYLSFISSFYAFYQGYYDLSLVPFSVGCSSILYWTYPDYSWRRYFDIIVVQIGLWYQCYRVWNADYWLYYYSFTSLSILFFMIGIFSYYRWKSMEISVITHCMLHILANLSNIIVYSGNIP